MKNYAEMIKKTGRRESTFAYIAGCLSKIEAPVIFETGCARHEHNWEGDGMSTLIWDAIATEHNGFVTTVDIDKKATQNCIELLGEDCVRTVVVTSDSVRYMRACEKMDEVDLLYLDSYDFILNPPRFVLLTYCLGSSLPRM